jgi:hypothetical protein
LVIGGYNKDVLRDRNKDVLWTLTKMYYEL